MTLDRQIANASKNEITIRDVVLANKGYDADAIRADLAERNMKAVIPGRSNRRVEIEYNRQPGP